MNLIRCIAERREQEAIERGDLDNLPGAGRPLQLDDDSMVPAELRMALRVLKNAGCLPPELETRREIGSLSQLMVSLEDEAERKLASRRLHYLMLQLNMLRGGTASLCVEQAYHGKLINRLD